MKKISSKLKTLIDSNRLMNIKIEKDATFCDLDLVFDEIDIDWCSFL
jgi:hypothetical protein